MPVTIGAKPESGFDQPLGLLRDCHRRIERFLDMLIQVTQRVRGGTLNAEERRALEAALGYFREAAPRHTKDEEESLFPRMRSCNDPQAQEVLSKLAALEADHVRADAGHREVDELGARWLQDGTLAPDATDRLGRVLADLRAIYLAHIQLEDAEVFPVAGAILSAESIRELGAEMAARRGL